MGVRRDHIRYSKHVTRGRRWQALRMAVLERDGFQCVKCGSQHRLECDHVEPVRTAPEKAFNPNNLQILCASCHTRKTRIECGHNPPNPRRQAWKKLVRETHRETNRAKGKTHA